MLQPARRGGLDVQPPPWSCDLADAMMFALPARHMALQDLCTRTLQTPSSGRLNYEPVVDFVVLTIQRLQGMRSTSPNATQHCELNYDEAAFWVMVRDAGRPADPERLLIPYIFADNTVAVACGREIYGYPKEHGKITRPSRATTGSIRALAAVDPNTPTAAIPDAELVSCKYLGLLPLSPALMDHPDAQMLQENARDVTAYSGMLGALGAFIAMIRGHRLNFVFLRQLLALGGGANCDLQQVVAATADVANPGLPTYQGWFRLCFKTFGSHPFASDLGLNLAPSDQGIDAIGARIEFGFQLNAGAVL